MDNIPGLIFLALFLAAFGWIIFGIFTKRGREISIYGGKVVRTVDDEIDQSKGMVRSKIKVHKVQKKNEIETAVVVERSSKMPLAFGIDTMNLSRAETLQLISMLQRALK